MWKRAWCVVLLLSACEWANKEPIVLPEVAPDDIVLSWAMVNRGASGDTMYMAIYGNRKMELVTKQPSGTMMRLERTLTREQLSTLVADLRKLDCCALESHSETAPSPKESQPELGINFGDVKCQVALWDSEWQEGHARECGVAVAKVHGRGFLRERAPESTPR